MGIKKKENIPINPQLKTNANLNLKLKEIPLIKKNHYSSNEVGIPLIAFFPQILLRDDNKFINNNQLQQMSYGLFIISGWLREGVWRQRHHRHSNSIQLQLNPINPKLS